MEHRDHNLIHSWLESKRNDLRKRLSKLPEFKEKMGSIAYEKDVQTTNEWIKCVNWLIENI